MPTSLFALLDDITVLLDDVAVLTKIAAKKTAGVLGDDLALNAQQVSGVDATRELPVVWAVAKGSARNKAILVPSALAVSALAPWAVTPILMLGGLYLCFEGFEKIAHRFLHREEAAAEEAATRRALSDPEIDLVAFEREKIRGAVRTDFILSAEIITITLGSVTQAPFGTRVAVLVAVSVLMTVGVYGLVAGIVKLDDLGLSLSRRPGRGARALDLLPQADSTCWVAGTVVDAQGQERSGWWRLRADGSVDPTFALGGLWSDSTAGATEVVTLAIGDNGVVALGLRRAHAAENQMEVWQLAPGGVMPTLVARSASGTSVAARLIWRDGSWRWLDNAGLALDPPAATASAVAVATAGSALPTPPAPAASAPAGVAIETAVATAVARPDPPTSLLPTALGIALLAAVTGALALWWRRRR